MKINDSKEIGDRFLAKNPEHLRNYVKELDGRPLDLGKEKLPITVELRESNLAFLAKGIEKLPKIEHRFILRARLGMLRHELLHHVVLRTYEEIAEYFNMPVYAVKELEKEAIKAIQEELSKSKNETITPVVEGNKVQIFYPMLKAGNL